MYNIEVEEHVYTVNSFSSTKDKNIKLHLKV